MQEHRPFLERLVERCRKLLMTFKDAKASLGVTDGDKLLLESEDPVDLAVGLLLSCDTLCPLVLADPKSDVEELYRVEECTKRTASFAV